MATLNDIAQRVKALVSPNGAGDEDFAYAVGQILFPELEALARDLARRPSMRHHVLTDPADVTVVLDGDGVADLSTLEEDEGVLLDCLKYGRVTLDGLSFPLKLVETPTQGALAGALDTMFARCWLVGPNLYTKGTDGNPLSGTLALAVPRVPGLDQVAGKVEGLLVDRLAARMGGAVERES